MKKIIRILIGSILVIGSMLCFFYPDLRDFRLQQEVRHITEELSLPISKQQFPHADYSDDKGESLRNLWEKLTAYNQRLISEGQKLEDTWSYEQSPVTTGDMPMEDFIIGSIYIPDMDVSLPLLLGASEENLAKGAAVLSETSMPIGGKDTNCVIAAHRGWSSDVCSSDLVYRTDADRVEGVYHKSMGDIDVRSNEEDDNESV